MVKKCFALFVLVSIGGALAPGISIGQSFDPTNIISDSLAQATREIEVPTGPFWTDSTYVAPPSLEAGIRGVIGVYHYQQCGQSWSGDQLGACPGETICSAGCAVTCVAMLHKTSGIDVDPGELNTWLTSNGGYSGGCLIKWDIAADYPGSPITWYGSASYSLSTVKSEIDAGNPVIAHVSAYGGHFVVIKGYEGSGSSAADYRVADPMYAYETNLANYTPYSEVQGPLRIYHNVGSAPSLTVTNPLASGLYTLKKIAHLKNPSPSCKLAYYM